MVLAYCKFTSQELTMSKVIIVSKWFYNKYRIGANSSHELRLIIPILGSNNSDKEYRRSS